MSRFSDIWVKHQFFAKLRPMQSLRFKDHASQHFSKQLLAKVQNKSHKKDLTVSTKCKKNELFSNYFLNFLPPQMMAVMGDGGHLKILQKNTDSFKIMVDNCLTFTP